MTTHNEFEHCKELLRQRGEAFIAYTFQKIPVAIFRIQRKKDAFVIECNPVIDCEYSWPLPHVQKRASRADAAQIRALYESTAPLSFSNIYFRFVSHGLYGKCSWSYSWQKIIDDPTMGLLESELAAKRDGMIAQYIAREGQFCCRYCGTATDQANKVVRVIISRTYKDTGMRRSFEYCSETCGAHDQMGHEG